MTVESFAFAKCDQVRQIKLARGIDMEGDFVMNDNIRRLAAVGTGWMILLPFLCNRVPFRRSTFGDLLENTTKASRQRRDMGNRSRWRLYGQDRRIGDSSKQNYLGTNVGGAVIFGSFGFGASAFNQSTRIG